MKRTVDCDREYRWKKGNAERRGESLDNAGDPVATPGERKKRMEALK